MIFQAASWCGSKKMAGRAMSKVGPAVRPGCGAHRQGGQHRPEVAHHPVHQVLGGAGQGVEFGRGLAVVDVVPAEHLKGDLIQAVGQVGDLRGGGVLDQGPGLHVGGKPDEGRLDRPGRVERRVGGLLGQQVLEDSDEGAEV